MYIIKDFGDISIDNQISVINCFGEGVEKYYTYKIDMSEKDYGIDDIRLFVQNVYDCNNSSMKSIIESVIKADIFLYNYRNCKDRIKLIEQNERQFDEFISCRFSLLPSELFKKIKTDIFKCFSADVDINTEKYIQDRTVMVNHFLFYKNRFRKTKKTVRWYTINKKEELLKYIEPYNYFILITEKDILNYKTILNYVETASNYDLKIYGSDDGVINAIQKKYDLRIKQI